MEAGYTETGNDTEKTTEHFTSSFEGNNVLITFQGSPFSSDSVSGSPFLSLGVSSCCDSERRVSRPPELVLSASAGSKQDNSLCERVSENNGHFFERQSRTVFLCVFLHVSTFRSLRSLENAAKASGSTL